MNETEFSKLPNFRNEVFEYLPNLQILDNKNKDGKEFDYSSEEDHELSDLEEDDVMENESHDENSDDSSYEEVKIESKGEKKLKTE